MGKYRKIDVRIWNDEKFMSLSIEGKLIFFMLLTHPNMTAIGAMRATPAGLSEEMEGYQKGYREGFQKGFQEVFSKGMAEHDEKACLITLPNFLKYNPPESPNVVKAWISALDYLPECSMKTRVIIRAKDFIEGLSEGFREALPEVFAKTLPNQRTENREQRINTPPTPPKGEAGGGGAGKPSAKARKPRMVENVFAPYGEHITALAKAILSTTPREDRDGRSIRRDPALLVQRLAWILEHNRAVTPEILLHSWRSYLASEPNKIKAPQYFFGQQADNGEGANWLPFARLIWSAEQKREGA